MTRQERFGALNIRKIGFVSLEGFSFSSSEYVLISGRDLFSADLEIPAGK